MKTRIFFIIFFFFSHLNENLLATETALVEVNERESPTAISLGGFCHVALALRWYGIRQEAYPFDWVITPSDSLIKVISEDFYNFFSLEHIHGVTNTYTGMTFLHDFPSLKEAFYPLEKGLANEENLNLPKSDENEYVWNYNKYMRRIERFKNALFSNKEIVLIRSPAIKEEALNIRDLFRSKYPQLNFKLVVINHDLANHEDWNEEGILNYYIPQEKNTDYNGPEWTKIMIDAKLIDFQPSI